MPADLADSWIDLVLAVRHPLSAPTWAKPMVILPSPPEPPGVAEVEPPPPQPAKVAAVAPANNSVASFLNTMGGPSCCER
ncbi:hypothetical protein GCM10022226_41870 [Sphaerisporangium flaviroseum]|uniref:Uncharacterized protein n=1 Tax=Sphaerisporangium flaviroseum TaxID=509199 RepID=A0ABP7IF49_9ACTN